MKIKLITFDFWNTIYDSSNGTKRNAYRYEVFVNEATKLGVKFDENRFQLGLKSSWEYFNNIWKNEHRTPSPIDTVSYFWKFMELPYNEESIENVALSFGDCILRHPPKQMVGVKEVISNLYENGYHLGIVSDTGFSPGVVLRKLLHNEGLLNYFTAFSFSDETGVSKPHPASFMKVLSALEHEQKESLHIGDIEKTDIEGAKKLGMRAIRYSGDTTNEIYKENTPDTIADAEIFSWDEFSDDFLSY